MNINGNKSLTLSDISTVSLGECKITLIGWSCLSSYSAITCLQAPQGEITSVTLKLLEKTVTAIVSILTFGYFAPT